MERPGPEVGVERRVVVGVEAVVEVVGQDDGLIKLIMEEKMVEKKCCADRDVVLALVLVMAGIIFLLNNMGLVSWEVWNKILRFWPVLLILGGVRALLGRGWLADLVMIILTVSVLGAVVLGAMNAVGTPILFFR